MILLMVKVEDGLHIDPRQLEAITDTDDPGANTGSALVMRSGHVLDCNLDPDDVWDQIMEQIADLPAEVLAQLEYEHAPQRVVYTPNTAADADLWLDHLGIGPSARTSHWEKLRDAAESAGRQVWPCPDCGGTHMPDDPHEAAE